MSREVPPPKSSQNDGNPDFIIPVDPSAGDAPLEQVSEETSADVTPAAASSHTPTKMTRLMNLGLRAAGLGTKFILTLYIARYLSLSHMGYYGLVTGAVFILMVALGLRFDYTVSRELVGATPLSALTIMRDQLVFYLLNAVVLAVGMLLLYFSHITDLTPRILIIIFVLSVLENWGDTVFVNLISMGRPLVANLVFFCRTAAWVFPVIGLGLLFPDLRKPGFIFALWMAGSLGSLFIAFYTWRYLPWRQFFKIPVGWNWIRTSIASCFFIWLGSMGGTLGYYLDRFILAHYLSLEEVGIATIYSSFGASLYALIHSGVLSFAYPHLIALHRAENKQAFDSEISRLNRQIAILALLIGVGIGAVVPIGGVYFGRPEFAVQKMTLWLILCSTWIRCISETQYYVLFARNHDRPLWVGSLLYMIPSFGFNLVLIPMVGLSGIGYSAVLSSFALFLWRGWYVRKGNQEIADRQADSNTIAG